MGQKTNPIILRLGRVKEWDFKYLEKKLSERAYYEYSTFEIKNCINKFFNHHGFYIKRCKIMYSEDTIQIFISYYCSEKITELVYGINQKHSLKVSPSNKIPYKKEITYLKKLHNQIYYDRLFNYFQFKKLGKVYGKALNIEQEYHKRAKIHRNEIVFFQKKTLLTRNKSTFENTKNDFLNKLSEFLETHLSNTKHWKTIITCQHLNKNVTSHLTANKVKLIKRTLPQLRRYSKNSFFKDGVNILFNSIINQQSNKLLSDYVAFELSKMKRHRFFFRFLKTALTLFCTEFKHISGIRIRIKGRINGVPRSKVATINVKESIKNLSIHTNTNYTESTAFTKNGSLGVKVWISEKINSYCKKCLRDLNNLSTKK